MSEYCDSLVVGGGIVGLAVAMRLASAGQSVIVIEAEDRISTQVSARNSEVIHAGLYYPQAWLKTRLCVEGKLRLYDFCKKFSVPYNNCGKLVVATSQSELSKLEALLKQAHDNGVTDCRLIERDEARTMEPEVECVAALHSPSSGIVCTHELAYALNAQLEEHGGLVSCNTRFKSARRDGDHWAVEFCDVDDFTISCANLINAAGLGAQAVAGAIEGIGEAHIPPLHLAKGNYVSAGKSPFSRLIYPLPQEGGLGVHATIDLGGNLRFGPDVEWIEEPDYSVDEGNIAQFRASIEHFWPEVTERNLQPDQAGIRPKLSGPGEPARDFMIEREGGKGDPKLVNLFGIESPGITSCLAIAETVAAKIEAAAGNGPEN